MICNFRACRTGVRWAPRFDSLILVSSGSAVRRTRRANNSYGLATIHTEHVSIEAGSVIFDYVAKSGQERYVALADDLVLEAVALPARAAGGWTGIACISGRW